MERAPPLTQVTDGRKRGVELEPGNKTASTHQSLLWVLPVPAPLAPQTIPATEKLTGQRERGREKWYVPWGRGADTAIFVNMAQSLNGVTRLRPFTGEVTPSTKQVEVSVRETQHKKKTWSAHTPAFCRARTPRQGGQGGE